MWRSKWRAKILFKLLGWCGLKTHFLLNHLLDHAILNSQCTFLAWKSGWPLVPHHRFPLLLLHRTHSIRLNQLQELPPPKPQPHCWGQEPLLKKRWFDSGPNTSLLRSQTLVRTETAKLPKVMTPGPILWDRFNGSRAEARKMSFEATPPLCVLILL